MKIYYRDEYDVDLHTKDSDAIPRVGENIQFVNEEWIVKSVTWMIEEDAVIIHLSQTTIRTVEKNVLSDQVSSLNHEINKIKETQNLTNKKARQLTDQIATMRQGINQHLYTESKKKNG